MAPFSPTSENPRRFSVWCVLAKLSAKPRYYSYTRPLYAIREPQSGMRPSLLSWI